VPSLLFPETRGPEVAELHQALLERAALPPAAIEEEAELRFGPITESAVRSFQASVGLNADGMVGPRTWAALAGDDVTFATIGATLLDLAEAGPIGRSAALVADGELQAGVREQPAGSNRGPRVDQYLRGVDGKAAYLLQGRRAKPSPADGWQGNPWCARFVVWCVEQAASALGVKSPIDGWGDLASAFKWAEAAKLRRCWDDSPAPGRIGLILAPAAPGRKPRGHAVHIVGQPNARGEVPTREGNSGDRVAARLRPVSSFTGGFVELG